MEQFIIISKELLLTKANITFINKEIQRLNNKGYHVGVYYNDTHAVLVRELDDTIFWTTNYDLLHYIEGNRSSVDDIGFVYPLYRDFKPQKFEVNYA